MLNTPQFKTVILKQKDKNILVSNLTYEIEKNFQKILMYAKTNPKAEKYSRQMIISLHHYKEQIINIRPFDFIERLHRARKIRQICYTIINK